MTRTHLSVLTINLSSISPIFRTASTTPPGTAVNVVNFLILMNTIALLYELKKLHPVYSRLEQQLQNITNTRSVSSLKPLEAKISEAQVTLG